MSLYTRCEHQHEKPPQHNLGLAELQEFSTGASRTLVATDVAARGLRPSESRITVDSAAGDMLQP